jgi:hypothetical protein
MNVKTASGRGWSRSAVVCGMLVVLAGMALADYGFDLTPRGDTVQHVAPSDAAEFHFTLTNTGTTSDVFRFDCSVISAVPGWTVVYCVRGVCVEPGNPVYDTLQAGGTDTTAKVTVYTNATEGEEAVSLRARSMGDTTLAESVVTHTIVGSGVEEFSGAGAPRVPFQVAPEPVRRGGQITLSFSTAKPVSFSVNLFDAAGASVSMVAHGTAPGGRHVINWRPDRLFARGVYLFRLTAGDESVVRKLVVE